MNKAECLTRAARAGHAAHLASHRASLYAVTFGGNDKLTQDALVEADAAFEAVVKWEQIAKWHPKTRDAAIRKQSLPAFLFGY